MDLIKEQDEARKIAAERGWKATMPLAERWSLSEEDWEIYELAFSIFRWEEMPRQAKDWFIDKIETRERALTVAREYEEQLAAESRSP